MYKKRLYSLAYEILINESAYKHPSKPNYYINPKNLFHYAAVGFTCKFLALLLNNLQCVDSAFDSLGRSFLYIGACYGHFNICRILLEKGADINI